MADPLFDLDVEHHEPVRASSSCCGARTSAPTVVFTSTRQLFGKPRYLPVDEEHPVAPVDVNGITKYATEQLHLLYHERVRPAGVARCGSPTCSGPASVCATTSRASCRSSSGARSPTRRSPCSATARRSATASTSTTSSSACCSRALAADAAGEMFNVGNDEHLVAARDRRRDRRGGRVGPGRARAVAARPRRHRHRLLLRRLVEGEADARLGAAHLVRRRHRAHGRVLPRAPQPGTCDRRRRRRPDPGRRPRAPGRGTRTRALGGDRRACVRSGSYLLGPETEAFEAEFAAFRGRRHAVARRVGHRGAAPRAASRSASAPATR